ARCQRCPRAADSDARNRTSAFPPRFRSSDDLCTCAEALVSKRRNSAGRAAVTPSPRPEQTRLCGCAAWRSACVAGGSGALAALQSCLRCVRAFSLRDVFHLKRSAADMQVALGIWDLDAGSGEMLVD